MGEEGKTSGAGEYEALEDALLRMPAVEPPADLEARLIAAIPRDRRARRERPGFLRVRALAAVAASIVAALTIAGAIILKGQDDSAQKAKARLLSDTSPRYILYQSDGARQKETNPCNIVLPLPYSRS